MVAGRCNPALAVSYPAAMTWSPRTARNTYTGSKAGVFRI